MVRPARPPAQATLTPLDEVGTAVPQDTTDNELMYFESIHLFVELLDQFFGNVCELDLVFNFNKVYMILDEFFLAGEVQETSKQAILHRVQELDKAE